MKKKTYRIAVIYEDHVNDSSEFESPKYHDAFIEAAREMKKDNLVQAVLIYSKTSQIVLKSSTTLPQFEGKNIL